MKRVRGPIARLDLFTEDGRKLVGDGAMLGAEPCVLMAIPPHLDGTAAGHMGAVPVGRIRFIRDGDWLRVDGEVLTEEEVEVPVGKYEAGLDVRFEGEDMERDAQERLIFHRWRPLGVTMHLGSGRNAFPDVDQLEVYEE